MEHRRRQRKNDFLYAAIMFAVFAVMVFNIAVAYFEGNGAVFAQVAQSELSCRA